MSAPVKLVSAREFARLDGCDDKLVRRAIKAGKLPVSDDGKIDAAMVGTGWRRQNRRTAEGADTAQLSAPDVRTSTRRRKMSAPAAALPDPSSLEDEDFIAEVLAGRYRLTGDAERVKENALAAVRLLEARRQAGDVVDLEVADAILFDLARSIRDAWLNWPSRVAPLIAATLGIPVEPLLEALNDHVGQHLAQLGEPEADFTAAD